MTDIKPPPAEPVASPAGPQNVEPEDVESLILVGGRRHGELVEISTRSATWVDLLSAEVYHRRPFAYARRDPAVSDVTYVAAYSADAMVHEDIAGDQRVAQAWWQAIALTRLFEAVGREVPISAVVQGPSVNGHGPGRPTGGTQS